MTSAYQIRCFYHIFFAFFRFKPFLKYTYRNAFETEVYDEPFVVNRSSPLIYICSLALKGKQLKDNIQNKLLRCDNGDEKQNIDKQSF